MKTKLLILGIAVLCLSAAPAMANLVQTTRLQDALDGLTTNPSGASSIDVYNDNLPDVGPGVYDSYWYNTAAGSSSTMIIEFAGWENTNKFGIYDPADETNILQIFDGSAVPGSTRLVTILKNTGEIYLGTFDPGDLPDATFQVGGKFGYYLDSRGVQSPPFDPIKTGVWYSDTTLNVDNSDHMYAYQGVGDTMNLPSGIGPGEIGTSYYILAWDDQGAQYSDFDYEDMVVLVESVRPVPVPAAILLGVLGLGIAGLKLRKYA